MNIRLLVVGKTDAQEIKTLIDGYCKRLRHYVKFEMVEIPDIKNTKNLSEKEQKEKEGMAILKNLKPAETLILLDERGTQYHSIAFSTFLQKKMNSGVKSLVFVVGGPYGFDENVIVNSTGSISLSKMTFSHQMVRLFFVEQLYRAFTILRNEPYHHQ